MRPPPDCARCRFYHVTWNPERPRGCRAFGFESRARPSGVVRRASGRECALFERRDVRVGRGRRT